MIHSDIMSTIDLAQGVQLTHLRSPLVLGDGNAHKINVAVVRNGGAVDLSGSTVRGSFVRADGVTVNIEKAETVNNMAIVTLPPECYTVDGRCVLAVKALIDNVISTLFLAEGEVRSASTNTIVADEETALSLDELFRRLDAGVSSVEASAEIAARAAEDAQAALGGADAVARAEAAATAAEAALARLEGIDVTALVQEIDTLKAATTPTLLWTAENEDGWTSGSITAPGVADWYLVDIETPIGHTVGINTGTRITAGLVTRYASTDNSQRTVSIVITAEGDVLTLASALALRHKTDDTHGTIGTTSITAITGLLKRGVSA